MRAALAAFALLAAACDSQGDVVCEDIGFCTAQSFAQVNACKANAAALRTRACAQSVDAYFECADSAYRCDGATPSFPGCDTQLTDARACLSRDRAGTACGAFDTALAACGGTAPPPGLDPCSPCIAGCYLRDVANVCAPRAPELQAFAACAQECPL